MPPASFKAPVLAKLALLLKPLGFKKSAAVFCRGINDVFHLIELQGSRRSSAAEALYTVNVAVFVPALIYEDVREFTKPSVVTAHWRQRLGRLTPEPEDTWWSARTPDEAEANAKLMSQEVV